jgi:hypothetical protein
MVVLAAAVGLLFLSLAWILLWQKARIDGPVGLRRALWVVGAWLGPLLFAAPFASQDVWLYGAQGKMVLNGLGGYRPASLLGHSVWTLGVDPRWLAHPSLYGPGALDLSALFVKVAGNRPWVAAECWRVAAVAGIVLCAWGVRHIVSLRGANASAAAVAGVANPAVLVVLVGGVHNDALMLGLAVTGTAVAVSVRGLWGLALGALGVAVKPPALLVVGAVCWWAWGTGSRARARGVLFGAITVVAVLVASGAGTGGGFGWLKALFSYGSIPGSFSLGARFLDVKSGPVVDAIELAGITVAVLLVSRAGGPGRWIAAAGWGLALLAITTTKPEPWYLAWAIMLLACGGLHRRSEVMGVLVLTAMMAGSVIALGVFWWFAGVVLLSWLGITSLLFRPQTGPSPRLQGTDDALA